ncbi:MAG TPA: hypothetical protein VFU81_10000, partial [Thermomicrobiales bacterium]|nr:hypothetical protein [Thermomicrobiales bacterium]
MQRKRESRRPAAFRRGARAVWMGLALALAPALVLAAMQLAPDSPSPATGHAQVIAHGVSPMPQGDAAWRVVLDTAELPADAGVEARALGFALADRAAIVIDDAEGNQQTRLAAGEAAFVADGARQLRASLGTIPASYYRLALVPAAQANDAGGDRLVFAGSPFAPPAGRAFDIDLVRDVLQPNEQGTLPATSGPALVLVTDGALDVSGGGQLPIRLAAGQAASLAGQLTLTATGGRPATYVAAAIGPEVPAPPAPPTGSITMHVLGCSQTTLDQARAAGFTGQTLAACAPLALDPPPALTLANGNALAPDKADPTTATYRWSSLLYSPFPVADLTPPTNYADYVLVASDGAIV